MRQFSKPPTSIEEQLNILISRGLRIDNLEHAALILRHKNYYRLRAYSFFLEKEKDLFFPNTTFEQIETLYNFDRTLRALCMQATAAIEVSLRTQFAYQSSHVTQSPIPHENEDLFNGYFQGFSTYHDFKKNKIHYLLLSSQETFIKHYRYNYQGFPVIPVWAMVEVITFSTLVSLYRNSPKSIKNAIRKTYNAPSVWILANWFHLCSVVRNTCAHHSSLWIKSFPNFITPGQNNENNRANLWQVVRMLYTLLSHIDDEEASSFKNSLISLVKDIIVKIPQLDICGKTGFPPDWEKSILPYW